MDKQHHNTAVTCDSPSFTFISAC